MATLTLNKPVSGATPRISGDPTLKPGRYRVTLVVNGTHGQSAPAALILNIVERLATGPRSLRQTAVATARIQARRRFKET